VTDTAKHLAVLENEISHTKRDLNKYFAFVRESMEEEKKHREELADLLQQIKARVDKQTYFISGVIATIAVVWTVIKVFL
jgi:tRNA A-37 threonylcarbamoyl transferase component Bud32